MSRKLILAALAALFSVTATAQSATARFAEAQLQMAQAGLQRAEEALASRDYELARRLAAQAGLDARIAYGMSDSRLLRRDAARVHESSAHLRWLVLQKHTALPR
jgi:hypothetical protein